MLFLKEAALKDLFYSYVVSQVKNQGVREQKTPKVLACLQQPNHSFNATDIPPHLSSLLYFQQNSQFSLLCHYFI